MTVVDLLSDTTYREQAVKQLHQLLGESDPFPVKATQIYGLRQIARQQPGKVENFANHQRERAERKYEGASEKAKPGLQAEINFWELIYNLCRSSTSGWSVPKEGYDYLPEKLRNLPARRQDMTRREHRELRGRKKKWLDQWKNQHIPAFFERFCTHCLYRIAKVEMRQSSGENDVHQQSQQEQNEAQGNTATHNAFQSVNLIQ